MTSKLIHSRKRRLFRSVINTTTLRDEYTTTRHQNTGIRKIIRKTAKYTGVALITSCVFLMGRSLPSSSTRSYSAHITPQEFVQEENDKLHKKPSQISDLIHQIKRKTRQLYKDQVQEDRFPVKLSIVFHANILSSSHRQPSIKIGLSWKPFEGVTESTLITKRTGFLRHSVGANIILIYTHASAKINLKNPLNSITKLLTQDARSKLINHFGLGVVDVQGPYYRYYVLPRFKRDIELIQPSLTIRQNQEIYRVQQAVLETTNRLKELAKRSTDQMQAILKPENQENNDVQKNVKALQKTNEEINQNIKKLPSNETVESESIEIEPIINTNPQRDFSDSSSEQNERITSSNVKKTVIDILYIFAKSVYLKTEVGNIAQISVRL